MAAKKQIKQLIQEMSEYQTELQKKIEEAKEEQQREFRNERAEFEAAYQAELQAKTAQISQLKAPEEQKLNRPNKASIILTNRIFHKWSYKDQVLLNICLADLICFILSFCFFADFLCYNN